MNKKWINSACEAGSSFEVCLPFTESSQQRYIWAFTGIRRKQLQLHTMHNNRNISNKYTIILRNKSNALQEISETLTPNDNYENFINAHMEAAAESIPTKLKAKLRAPWETLAVKKNVMTKLHPYAIKGT